MLGAVSTENASSAGARAAKGKRGLIPESLYWLDPRQAGPLSAWPELFERCVADGFDALLIASPFSAGQTDRLIGALGYDGPALDALALLSKEASLLGLPLFLDVPLADLASLPREASEDDAALDPRRENHRTMTNGSAGLSARTSQQAFWQAALRDWIDAGFTGFRLTAPPQLAWLRQTLIENFAGETQFIEAAPARRLQDERLSKAVSKSARRPPVEDALAAPRIVIANLSPSVDGGRHAAKCVVGDRVDVEADVFAEGHDELTVRVLWRALGASRWFEAPMAARGNDRYRGHVALPDIGRYQLTIEAWRDGWASYCSDLRKKHAAGQRLTIELAEGRGLIEKAAGQARKNLAAPLLALLKKLGGPDEASQIALLLDPATASAMAAVDPRSFTVVHEPFALIDAERRAAAFGAWYEIFPRSMSGDAKRHGNFDDVIASLPRIRDMGFDVLYLPPIHPIGATNRKGRNNTLTPAADDPGSPYAIGSADGGHDSIHPQLGTIEDFRRLRDAAAAQGLELALDFAIQCSPDHPWLSEHPEWFAWRADGSIKYAENPPKKYEDIVNVDFFAPGATPSLWTALRDVVLFWVSEGVRIFRVDNPHTKPLPFWEWLIADVRAQYPDVIFLAEAFTRPGPMQQLAKIGFSQSYTYFTWRNSKAELTEYLTELTTTPQRDYFRPHFFVNTPDINPYFLQNSGRPGHMIRSALAATLSGLWGVYSGFELCEARALPGREEYLDSEKYQIKVWDWNRPGHITQEIAALNRIRRENPALHSHLGVEFFNATNEQILWFGKSTANRDNVLLIAINLDPHGAQQAEVELPLWRWNLPDHAALDVEDLLDDTRFVWRGKVQHIRLDPAKPYSIWRVRPAGEPS